MAAFYIIKLKNREPVKINYLSNSLTEEEVKFIDEIATIWPTNLDKVYTNDAKNAYLSDIESIENAINEEVLSFTTCMTLKCPLLSKEKQEELDEILSDLKYASKRTQKNKTGGKLNKSKTKQNSSKKATSQKSGGNKSKTDKHVMVGMCKRCIYEGPRGGQYVKQDGDFVSLSTVSKKK